MTKRLTRAKRKQQIMAAAMQVATRIGYKDIKRSDVAKAAEVTNSLVSRYWVTMPQLQRAIMRNAVSTQQLAIIAQGLAARDKNALKAPKKLQQEALQQLIG